MIEIIMKGFANEGTSTQPHKTKAAYLRQRGELCLIYMKVEPLTDILSNFNTMMGILKKER
ncbi:hypothetical protein Pedsa_0524 [Pseudopedobacter saltans DSM 12145]|uniref:Uncharacterized protein n=1 Tax=Pseudopedobacter saltans (strain ATCC 51119 / DSM 12145 / JCM 21818 / CCUG 39354 / LMG 10337 / NBRC 100064 / NCIMB 13643) TaxID=762903 RepID=F0S6M9_PSESL|nr:hypothetical protein Pedsa_0524 [Pseudopedobacter saltans DSM 12145]